MSALPPQPVIHEINTWVWLRELERRTGRPVGLGDVSKDAWDEITPHGVDAVWLMGVWERSPEGLGIALADPALRAAFTGALPDAGEDDIVGSPYCIRRYTVDERIGGPDGLAVARAELDRRGIGLLLDYVPNHVAPDSPWLTEHPDYFVRGTRDDLERDPAAYYETGGAVYARGRDPYFAPWPDVVQLNAYSTSLREGTTDVLRRIGGICDGVRCDMAMLMMNDVFGRTWGERAGPMPPQDFWPTVITAVRERRPGMTFVAEAYWDLEWELKEQGFDFCYDKRLYDRLVHESPESVRGHLQADLDYQRHLVRFLENHDEPRAAETLGPAKERAAATLIATLPGATLWHEGQFTGRRTHLPVFLTRRPDETPDVPQRAFHEQLLARVHKTRMRTGEWRLLSCDGWPDNPTHRSLLAWCWSGEAGRHVIVVNLSDRRAQAMIRLPWPELAGSVWQLSDLMGGVRYERDGDELLAPGLYTDLEAWGSHILSFEAGRG
ncbi:alpha-amylase family glycosyl hydrolase [Streptomyces sp. NBC_01381]|uniref:alpha-amylase family glycosyl hydrolase n=1 Tax=Streptomyces sp. NBC_01381 TaxID=2903845 RepID=UPI00224DA8B0|nr:alpha-amylase family glycosyl hydrolase [Streptomyces sp. NBC_01381]MCX4672271.1 alpha-amylase family glycosyl hydrolase [Streptomyces sp. NBC_01381]